MIYRGKRFFDRLKEGELAQRLAEGDGCFVQYALENRYVYAFFDSWEAFRCWYHLLPEKDRTFAEVIRNRPQKFRLDIDCPADKWVFGNDKYALLNPLCTLAKELLGEDTKFLIYESVDVDRKKFSFHIITKNVCLESSEQCIGICKLIKNKVSFSDIIDDSVYKNLQCFRMEGSRKPDSWRYKYLIDTNKISDMFLDGLISEVSKIPLRESFVTGMFVSAPRPRTYDVSCCSVCKKKKKYIIVLGNKKYLDCCKRGYSMTYKENN